ncbi:hypothetical protein MMC25_005420 [Agyrium rufum]|nr:hypothetical protein [Agyrium rufum]
MIPPIPRLEDYDVSPQNGFLPNELPLEILPDSYYDRWEAIARNLQALVLSKRLREVVKRMPILSTSHLRHPAEWRRAYSLLVFMANGYIWGGQKPEERVPPPISVPLLEICEYLELPPVATYAGVCLWNFKPIFNDEPIDSLDNLSTLTTFTGSLDESWFYLVSVAIEARGGPVIPLLLRAIAAARVNDSRMVTECLHTCAECLDEIGSLLSQMYENCDPHVFYHRIRPFLAGSKNMAEAGLPNGVIYEDGSGREEYRQYGGGSNAQSSLIQLFDIVLGIEHRPTGEKRKEDSTLSSSDSESQQGSAPPARHNFIQDMRSYMPGPHRRFLEHVSNVANIREYVEAHKSNRSLSIAYDACLAMLRSLRDKHIQMVSRYIVVKSRESRSETRSTSPREKVTQERDQPRNIANPRKGSNAKKLRGTGGTALIPFLKQARDETGEPAIDTWAKRLLGNGPANSSSSSSSSAAKMGFAALGKMGEHADGETEIVGLAGTWAMDDSEGGICHW